MNKLSGLIIALFLIANAGFAKTRAMVETEHEYYSESRSALVIGNSGYEVGKLINPANDATLMAESLRKRNFKVTLLKDLGQKDLIKAIRKFGKEIQAGGVGFFYYAGHAMEVGGFNYLVPVDALIDKEEDVELEGVKMDRVIGEMKHARNRVNIIVMDACRNNPFGRSYRSASKGLSTIDAPSGTFIAYATSPGKVAADNPEESNSLYTAQLAANMEKPGMKIEDVFKKVRAKVRVATDNVQTPWESSSLVGDFYFQLPDSDQMTFTPEPEETAPVAAVSPAPSAVTTRNAASMTPEQPAASAKSEGQPEIKEGGKKKWLWWAIGGAAVAAGVGATILLTGGDDGGDKAGQTDGIQ